MPKVNRMNQVEINEYNTFIRQSKEGQITQDTRWHAVKENWVPYYIYLKKEEKIVAAASILVSKGPKGKKFAYCTKGPVMNMENQALFKELVEECVAYLPKDVYVLKFDPEIPYSQTRNQQFIDAGFYTYNRNIHYLGMHGTIQPRLNMVIDFETFEQRPTSIYDIVPSKIKNKLKKAKKDGVEVSSGLDESFLRVFYQSYQEMSIRHGISYRPMDYFERMVEAFQGSSLMKIYIAKRNETVLATGIAFNCGNKVWYMYAGSASGKVYNAPYAIQEAMIQWALDSGCRRYDMGGIEQETEEDGLYTFKRNFVRQPASEYMGEIDYVMLPETYQQVMAEKFGFSVNLSSDQRVYS